MERKVYMNYTRGVEGGRETKNKSAPRWQREDPSTIPKFEDSGWECTASFLPPFHGKEDEIPFFSAGLQ